MIFLTLISDSPCRRKIYLFNFFGESLSKSKGEPATSKFPQWHSKIGKAKPQYLFLEISQSDIFFSQSISLLRPKEGIHLIFLADFISDFLNLAIDMYHSSAIFHTSSVLHRQQTG